LYFYTALGVRNYAQPQHLVESVPFLGRESVEGLRHHPDVVL
jgi:hypothetical protein